MVLVALVVLVLLVVVVLLVLLLLLVARAGAGFGAAAAPGDTAGTAVGGAVIRGGVGLKGKQETTKGEQTSICVIEPIKGNV